MILAKVVYANKTQFQHTGAQDRIDIMVLFSEEMNFSGDYISKLKIFIKETQFIFFLQIHEPRNIAVRRILYLSLKAFEGLKDSNEL